MIHLVVAAQMETNVSVRFDENDSTPGDLESGPTGSIVAGAGGSWMLFCSCWTSCGKEMDGWSCCVDCE